MTTVHLLLLLLLLLLLTEQLLLAAELEDFAVRVGVLSEHERGAGGGAVLRDEAAGLVTDAAGVAQRLRAQRSGPPLRRLLGGAVRASARHVVGTLSLLSAAVLLGDLVMSNRLLRLLHCCGPAGGGGSGSLAPRPTLKRGGAATA